MKKSSSRKSVVPGSGQGTTLGKADFEKLSHFRYRLRCFLRLSEDLCQKHGLTQLQYLLLLHVKGFPGRDWATIGELAEKLQAKHNGTVALVDRCEKAGLVKRIARKEDRRQVAVHLQPKGAQLLESLAALHQPELQLLREEFNLPAWGGPAAVEVEP
ncbi:MarR family transcriptional regulator [Georgfuchsia toluolica]|uniref:MarR family transcriptional regulator n=1 Tax=Georgfuchsia toluolica TaxID=424218 RepID=A0A916NIY0_9PROT|nr:MarR family transcriptional regulator [Georgfuchsia toluolica]CAG4885073.1 MarR family transcriptional regulator [Georgfuchsia toluolica]